MHAVTKSGAPYPLAVKRMLACAVRRPCFEVNSPGGRPLLSGTLKAGHATSQIIFGLPIGFQDLALGTVMAATRPTLYWLWKRPLLDDGPRLGWASVGWLSPAGRADRQPRADAGSSPGPSARHPGSGTRKARHWFTHNGERKQLFNRDQQRHGSGLLRGVNVACNRCGVCACATCRRSAACPRSVLQEPPQPRRCCEGSLGFSGASSLACENGSAWSSPVPKVPQH